MVYSVALTRATCYMIPARLYSVLALELARTNLVCMLAREPPIVNFNVVELPLKILQTG